MAVIKFKYHPDNVIYENGAYLCTYSKYMTDNPECGIIEGNFFEILESSGNVSVIDDEGHHIPISLEDTANYPDVCNFLILYLQQNPLI